MFDEPWLRPSARWSSRDVFAIIRRLNQEEGLTIILVEQNVAVWLGLAESRLRAGERPHR